MPKIEAAIFSATEITETQAISLNELEQQVQTLIDNDAETSEIITAYHEFIEACFDLHQYERTVKALDYLKENQQDASDADKGLSHRRFGILAFSRKEFDVANSEFEQGLTLAQEAENVELEGKILSDLGNVAAIKEDFEAAIEFYEAAIEINEDNEIDAATPFHNLALVYLEVQDLGEAAECFESALDIFTEEGNVEQQEALRLQLGAVYFANNELKEALVNYHYATELQEENSEKLGKTYVSMTSVLLKMNQHQKAAEYYEKALPILIQHGDIELHSEHYFQIANLYNQYLDNFEKAIHYYGKSLEVAKTDTENDEWRELMIAKLEDSIEFNKEALAKQNKKQSKKSGFFGRLFGK